MDWSTVEGAVGSCDYCALYRGCGKCAKCGQRVPSESESESSEGEKESEGDPPAKKAKTSFDVLNQDVAPYQTFVRVPITPSAMPA